MKRNALTLTVACVLIVVCILLLFVFQVRKSEAAVVTHFGKIDRVETESGPYLRWPWPIEMVYKIDRRIQNFDSKFEQCKLPDQNMIFLSVYVGYQIDNPTNFFPKFLNGSIPEAEKVLSEMVRSAMKEVAGQHSFPDFVSTNPKEMKFVEIENEILQKVQSQVHEKHYGLNINFIQMRKIGLPESVTQNVLDRMSTERQVYIDTITAEANESATKIKSAADSQAYAMISDAEAKAFAIRGEGEAQMVKSLQIMQQNPTLATFNLEMDAMVPALRGSTLVLDQSSSPLQWLQEGFASNSATVARAPLPSDLKPVTKAQ